MDNIIDKTVISTVLLLLIIFIILCILKLHIYFDSYNYLSKKINTGRGSNIANMSFYKFYYNKKHSIQGITIEIIITFIMILLTLLAYIGFVRYNNINHGYLNYYYGDVDEYSAVNNFIILIIIVCIIYCSSYLYWFMNDKEKDDILYKNEENLRKFIIENLDKKYLDFYTFTPSTTSTENLDIDILDKYILTLKKDDIIDDPPIFLFKLCFTYHIMSKSNHKFNYISKDISKIYNKKDNETDEDRKNRINDSLNNIDIIANYDHSNNIALPKLYIMINDIKEYVNKSTDAEMKKNLDIDNILTNLIKNSFYENKEKIEKKYNDGKKYFMKTIVSFKEIHDKYYRYYMVSIFITNIIVSYAILILIYLGIIIYKYVKKNDEESKYYVYNYKLIYNSYIFYILIIYYFITCPIIIFSI